nr:Arginine-glutamic acid dipeptide repeats protein [Ipomoea batatas]
MEGLANKSSKRFPSKKSSGTDSVCGDHKVFPRVGAEYQAEIPLVLECDRGQLTKASFNGGIKVDTSDHVVESNQDDTIDNGKIAGLLNLPSRLRGKSIDIDSGSLQERKAHLGNCDGFHLVLGLPNKGWKQIEHSSFLLGLYIFGKNLAIIKRFVGSKDMGDILSYYYGKFYKSKDYQRWSDSRKLRGRRCISGQRLFMGGRQQELLSRLSSRVSEECLRMLIKASKLLGDGNITLEEYVFSLRDKVGIENLVEAVAIGKGKRDLTGTSMDYTKAIQSVPVRPRLPNSKPCSSLTATEIIKFLTGKFRLRKAELSELFWGAVWPRLLARGWHSEQPSDLSSAGTRQSLVFLVPDVSKFSRSLAKGTHFFSSISDVLKKVASEPSLLEQEVNAYNDEEQEEKHVINPEQNNSASNQHSMEFTVVDTIMFTGVGSGKVWEMRSLPLDRLSSASSGHLNEENHGSDPMNVGNVEAAYGDADNDITSISNDEIPNGPVSLITEEKTTQSITQLKPRFSTQIVSISDHTNLAVCSNRGLSHKTENMYIKDEWLKEGKLESQSSLPDAPPSQNFSSDTCFSSSQGEIHVRNRLENSLASEQSHKNSTLDNPEDNQRNNPDSLSAANKSSSPTEQHSEMLESINAGAKLSSSPCETEQHSESNNAPPVISCQRRSSRYKPSARALEAIAYGFMEAKTKRKRTNSSTSTSSSSSQRVRKSKHLVDENVTGDPCKKEANDNNDGKQLRKA